MQNYSTFLQNYYFLIQLEDLSQECDEATETSRLEEEIRVSVLFNII